MSVSINGPNKIITLESGVTSVDAADIYSDWKRWVGDSDNSKYQIAFDTVGGDPLSPGINAGAYYFIRNDLGWRIRPPEENITIYIAGNLAPRDSSFPILIPTTGDFSVLVAGLQPVTQSVAALLTTQHENAYNGRVYIDSYDGISGSVYPIGTAGTPVNNFNDAITIAENYGFSTFNIHGNVTFNSGQDLRNYTFFSDSSAVSNVYFNHNYVGGCTFVNFSASGYLETGSDKANFNNCFISDCYELQADFKECIFNGTIHWEPGTHVLAFCAAYSLPTFDFGNYSGVNLVIRNWAGPVIMKSGAYAENSIVMDSFSSNVIFDETFVAGDVTIYGIGQYTNNSTGSFTPATALLKSPQIDTIEKKLDNLTAISL